MLLAVGLDGIAQAGVTGVDEEGQGDVGFGVGGELWMGLVQQGVPVVLRGLSRDVLPRGEPALKLLTVVGSKGSVGEERGAYQHEREEPLPIVSIVDVDVGIGEQAPKARGIVVGVGGGALSEPMAEEEGDLALEVLDEIACDELLGDLVGKGDVAVVEVVEADALCLPEDGEGDADADSALLDLDALYYAGVVFPVLYLQEDSVSRLHVAHGGCRGAEEDMELAVVDELAQLGVLPLGDGDLLARLAAIGMEAQTGACVPVGTDYLADALGGCLDEHEAVEDAAELVGGIGTHVEVGDIVVEGVGT